MRALSVITFLAGIGLGIWILICSFSTWISFWGAGGAVFNVFLLPVAVIAYPPIEYMITDDAHSFMGYIDIVLFFILMGLGNYFSEKAE